MAWSLWVLGFMALGIFTGRRNPCLVGLWRWGQMAAVTVVLLSMGASLRGFEGVFTTGLTGAAVGLSAVVGSVAAALIYERFIHRGELP